MVWLSRSLSLQHVGARLVRQTFDVISTTRIETTLALFLFILLAVEIIQATYLSTAFGTIWLIESVVLLLAYYIIFPSFNLSCLNSICLPLWNGLGLNKLISAVFGIWLKSNNQEAAIDTVSPPENQIFHSQNYHNFIEQNSEGIWCIALYQPLSIHQAEIEQIEHLYQQGYIADCNQAFARMHGYTNSQLVIGLPLKSFLNSSNLYDVEFFQAFIRSDYRLIDMELQGKPLTDRHEDAKNTDPAKRSTFLCSLVSKIENGQTHSIWGTQHDITKIKQAWAQQQPNYQQVQQFNTELEQQVQQRTAQLQQASEFEITLKRITDKVRDSLDEAQILQTAVQELGVGIGVSSCNAAIYDLEAGTSTIVYEYNPSIVPFKGHVSRMANFPELYNQLLAGQYFQFCSIQPSPIRGRVAMLACPIVDDQKVLGDLWLITDRDYGFKDLELRLVQQVANQCAIALRQARLYQAAQSQVEQLEKLNTLKDDFLSTVSHELRTPVSNMKMSIHMLDLTLKQPDPASAVPPKAIRYLQVLRDECEREINLINDLLDLQRLEAGVHHHYVESIPLKTWLPELVERFQTRAKDHQQTLQITLDSQLSTLISDPISLERALTELLNNACKYTPAGETITLIGSAMASGVQLQVNNTGVEIPDEELSQIFNKFYRIVKSDPWKQGGTGLGLTLVQKLLEHLGGSITVESANGQTSFTLEIPHATLPD